MRLPGPPRIGGDHRRCCGGLAPPELDAFEDIRALRRAHGACGNNPQFPLGGRGLGGEADGVVTGLIAQARRHDDLAARDRRRNVELHADREDAFEDSERLVHARLFEVHGMGKTISRTVTPSGGLKSRTVGMSNGSRGLLD